MKKEFVLVHGAWCWDGVTERLSARGVDLKRFYAIDVPRTYIRCLKDIAVPADRALAYAQRLGVKPIELDAGHDAMLSAPEAVGRILDPL